MATNRSASPQRLLDLVDIERHLAEPHDMRPHSAGAAAMRTDVGDVEVVEPVAELAAQFATRLQQLAVHMDDVARPGLLVEVVDVLRHERQSCRRAATASWQAAPARNARRSALRRACRAAADHRRRERSQDRSRRLRCSKASSGQDDPRSPRPSCRETCRARSRPKRRRRSGRRCCASCLSLPQRDARGADLPLVLCGPR